MRGWRSDRRAGQAARRELDVGRRDARLAPTTTTRSFEAAGRAVAGPLRAGTPPGRASTRRWRRSQLDAVVDVGRGAPTTRAIPGSRSPTWRRSSATTRSTRSTSAGWPPTTASGLGDRRLSGGLRRHRGRRRDPRGRGRARGLRARARGHAARPGARVATTSRELLAERRLVAVPAGQPTMTLPFIRARSATSRERSTAATSARSAAPRTRIRSGSERSSSSCCLVSAGSSTRAAIA